MAHPVYILQFTTSFAAHKCFADSDLAYFTGKGQTLSEIQDLIQIQ